MHAPPCAAPRFSLLTSHFSLPKAGNSAEEYEDAWATSESAEVTPGSFACAVADGATETSFSGLWARLLTAAYCAGVDTPDALFDVLPLVQEEWRREIAAIPLPWYAEEKARRGAFAALTGLTIVAPEADDAAGGQWTALASGDSCLFQVRDDDLVAACPLTCSEDFTNRPTLLSSDPASNDRIADTLVYAGGTWLPGDRFYLLTDALACWFLAAFEAGDRPWHILDAFLDADTEADAETNFAAWIADLRAARALRNDDVTLLGERSEVPWPTPQDYNEAVQNPALNFDDPELRGGTPELTSLGLPRAITGGFASVYRLHCDGRDWAVRCFLREIPDQQERYAAIGRQLAAAKLPYTVGFDFLPEGIRVGGRPYPLLKMEWVQGESLDRWIERHLGDPAALRGLADRWVAMLRALRAAGIAHGDLQHGNILVGNDELRLIDYDGMFVPALAGRHGTEVGHRNYQHPRRAETDFGPGVDNFAAWSIHLSLRALGVEPGLWARLGAGDEGLLLRREDYERPAASAALQALEALPDPDLKALIARFRALLALDVASVPPLDGTEPQPRPARRSTTSRRRGGRNAAPVPVRQPIQVTGAAAWLTDHLTPAAPVAVAASYLPERVLVGLCGGTLLGLAIAAAVGLLTVSLVAPASGIVAALALLLLGLRYLASPLLPRLFATQARFWRVEARLAWLGMGVQQLDRRLARLDGREARELDGLNARRQAVAREAREAIAALDQSLKRFAVERQLLRRAEEDELAQGLRDLRHRAAADHLAGYPVLTAAIPGLGPQLKLRLLTAGVRTAAQIRDVRVAHAPAAGPGKGGGEVVQIEVPGRGFVQVNGLGRKKAHALLAWRQLLETQSAAALPEALPVAEDAAIRLRYHTRQQALDRREAAATRTADRRKEAIRQQLRERRAALDHQAADIRDQATRSRQQIEYRLSARQAGIASAHLALALARRDLAAYEQVRFARYLKRVLFFSR